MRTTPVSRSPSQPQNPPASQPQQRKEDEAPPPMHGMPPSGDMALAPLSQRATLDTALPPIVRSFTDADTTKLVDEWKNLVQLPSPSDLNSLVNTFVTSLRARELSNEIFAHPNLFAIALAAAQSSRENYLSSEELSSFLLYFTEASRGENTVYPLYLTEDNESVKNAFFGVLGGNIEAEKKQEILEAIRKNLPPHQQIFFITKESKQGEPLNPQNPANIPFREYYLQLDTAFLQTTYESRKHRVMIPPQILYEIVKVLYGPDVPKIEPVLDTTTWELPEQTDPKSTFTLAIPTSYTPGPSKIHGRTNIETSWDGVHRSSMLYLQSCANPFRELFLELHALLKNEDDAGKRPSMNPALFDMPDQPVLTYPSILDLLITPSFEHLNVIGMDRELLFHPRPEYFFTFLAHSMYPLQLRHGLERTDPDQLEDTCKQLSLKIMQWCVDNSARLQELGIKIDQLKELEEKAIRPPVIDRSPIPPSLRQQLKQIYEKLLYPSGLITHLCLAKAQIDIRMCESQLSQAELTVDSLEGVSRTRED